MPKFRDPIHGFIEVSELELKIIDSAPFQRLRHIRQLATTYLVYHGAEHTRFGHSLGVMHLVTRAFDGVVGKNPSLFDKDPEINKKKICRYRQMLRLIALTHDLGHAPFSHASEELFQGKKKHEDYTKEIIQKTEIAEYINAIGKNCQSDLGQEYGITPQLLWKIYGEDSPKAEYDEEYIWPDFLFLKGFMDGEMDCDKMDYLLRDSKFCGVNYGLYDLDRFLATLTVQSNPQENEMRLAIERGGVQAFEEFVLARYFMFIQVYFHKTRRYFDRLLVECLKKILPGGKYPVELEDYLLWDDDRALYEMKMYLKKKQGKKAETTQDWNPIEDYLCRKTMTCVYESPAHERDVKYMELAYKSIGKELGSEDLPFLLKDYVDKKAHKLSPAAMNDGGGQGVQIRNRMTGEFTDIMQESLILEGIVQKIFLQRIYVNEKNIDLAKGFL